MKISKYCGTCTHMIADISKIKPDSAIQNKCDKNSKHFDSFNINEKCSMWKLSENLRKTERRK